MAYLTVTTQFDVVEPGDGQLSLREAIEQANASGGLDTIRFSAAVVGQTLVLTGGQLTITDDVTIDGNSGGAAAQTTIDGDHASGVLSITGGSTEATLDGLVVTNGRLGDSHFGEAGGGIAVHDAVLIIRNSRIIDNTAFSGGGMSISRSNKVIIENTKISNNTADLEFGGSGGGISISHSNVIINNTEILSNAADNSGGIRTGRSNVSISRSVIANNNSNGGGGISSSLGQLNISESSIVGNIAHSTVFRYVFCGGICADRLIMRNSTVTGNRAGDLGTTSSGYGGGIEGGIVDIANSIVAGNTVNGPNASGPDILYSTIQSNGHNVFGSDVAGNIPGDRENIAAGTIFAAVDPATGGGKLNPDGTVALKNSFANPALSAADPLAASAFDQLGAARPQPAGSLPDLGAVELNQPLSTGATANNDVRSGTNAANNLTGIAGNDFLKGLGGNDTVDGGDGGDLLDGGPGNDKLTGGTGLDLVAYPGTVAVVIDLSGTVDTAKRGSEKDTLISIEGALGSSGNDTFKGDALANEFQGKTGKDTMTGGGGRDTWDFNEVTDSPAGATRDLVTDFAPGQDVIDLAGIDADSSVPGNQSFRWVAKATLTGAAQLGYFVSGGMTIVRASTDADAAAEVEIQLTGTKTLTQGDFRP